jgi:hypothetical protein
MPGPTTANLITADPMELSRRIGYARGQIQEALGMLDGRSHRSGSPDVYWAYKALTRALDELDGGTTRAGQPIGEAA